MTITTLHLSSAPPDGPTLTYARTVERHLVHREALGEVFLTDTRRVDEDRFSAAAQLPRSHAYYGDHLLRPPLYDPMLMLEACRQAGLAGAHAHYAVPIDDKAILTHLGIHLQHPQKITVGTRPCELSLLARTTNRVEKNGVTTGLDYTFRLTVVGTPIGYARMGLRFKSPESYARLRLRQRGDTPPPLSSSSPRSRGVAAPPHLVGRANPDNVVLLDVEERDGATRALLRLPCDHPSLFDHPQDHIPGMVLAEAARQLAGYAVIEELGMSPTKTHGTTLHAVFTKFGELEPATELSAVIRGVSTARESDISGLFHTHGGPVELDADEAAGEGARVDQIPIDIDVRQAGETIARISIGATSMSGLSSSRAA